MAQAFVLRPDQAVSEEKGGDGYHHQAADPHPVEGI